MYTTLYSAVDCWSSYLYTKVVGVTSSEGFLVQLEVVFGRLVQSTENKYLSKSKSN